MSGEMVKKSTQKGILIAKAKIKKVLFQQKKVVWLKK